MQIASVYEGKNHSLIMSEKLACHQGLGNFRPLNQFYKKRISLSSWASGRRGKFFPCRVEPQVDEERSFLVDLTKWNISSTRQGKNFLYNFVTFFISRKKCFFSLKKFEKNCCVFNQFRYCNALHVAWSFFKCNTSSHCRCISYIPTCILHSITTLG